MSGEVTGFAVPSRPGVTLRTGGSAPGVVARTIAVGTPGTAVAQDTATDALMRSLGIAGDQFGRTAEKLKVENDDEEFKRGQMEATKNQKDWAKAVEEGIVSPTANPWFIKGYHNQDGRAAGLDMYTQMRNAYANSPAKGSDDPAVFQKWKEEWQRDYMAKIGAGKSADWYSGFKITGDSAVSQINAEHAQQAEQAVVAKQEANTGAEVNIILNGTKDPKVAADQLNQLGEKLRLMGMPKASFEKVVAEAIIAKAKLGDPEMLKTMDYVKTGDGTSAATLASNPRVASARVDADNWITEKRRGDTRWAWANDDRQWTLKQREWATEQHKRATEEYEHKKAEWGRTERSRSLLSQIVLGTMADPAGSSVTQKDNIKTLAEINPQLAESALSFQNSFLTRSEKVPDHVEKPVLAQLQRDMIAAAGDPARAAQVLKDIVDQSSAGKLNKDTAFRLMDDAQRIASFDPTTSRKLHSPEVQKVRSTAERFYQDPNTLAISGSKALDALYAEQAINSAVLDHLKKSPGATPQELETVATKALQAVIPSNANVPLGQGGTSKLVQDANKANTNANSAPKPQTAEELLTKITPASQAEFIKRVTDAQARSIPEMLRLIGEFDQGMGVPGIGRLILERNANPPPPPDPKKKGR